MHKIKKMIKRAVLVFSILLFFSCKDEKKSMDAPVDTVIEKVVKDDVLTITLEVRTEQDDKFEIYYVDDLPENGFSADKRLASYIKGGNDYQLITFTLPNKIWPYNLRFDIGDNNNKYETPVEIKSITFKYNGNIFEIDKSIMDSFFQPNVYLEPITDGYLRKIVDDKYDPFLIAKPILIKKMELEL